MVKRFIADAHARPRPSASARASATKRPPHATVKRRIDTHPRAPISYRITYGGES